MRKWPSTTNVALPRRSHGSGVQMLPAWALGQGHCKAPHHISVRAFGKTAQTHLNMAFSSCLSQNIRLHTHSLIFFGPILQHNIARDVNWNLVKHKNFKLCKIQQSCWYHNYLADLIHSCNQHNLISNGYVAGLNYFALPNMDFCCSIPLPTEPILKPTTMPISSWRYTCAAKTGRELSLPLQIKLPDSQPTDNLHICNLLSILRVMWKSSRTARWRKQGRGGEVEGYFFS